MFSAKYKFDEKNRIANKKRDIGDKNRSPGVPTAPPGGSLRE